MERLIFMKIQNFDFDLIHTFECGQCFRWNKNNDGSYIGVVGNSVISVAQDNNDFIFDCEDIKLINTYFDFDKNYTEIKNKLFLLDDVLPKAIPTGYGIRLLKQDPWEALVSFIISANNNIPRIKKIIESLCMNFGKEIRYKDNLYYSFPDAKTLSVLSVEQLNVIKSGFRAKYIIDAAKKVSDGIVALDSIYSMDTNEAREYLKQIKGVGNKVADCILLFAYQKYDVFPKDVWIKKVLNDLYGVDEKNFDLFVKEHFGELAGFAQQYLFYYMRG